MTIDFYKETRDVGDPYRQAYLEGLEQFSIHRNEEKQRERDLYAQHILTKPEQARQELKERLGWPLTEKFTDRPSVKKTFVAKGNGITIWRMEINVLGGIPFYGILFQKDSDKPLPLVIAQHGGQGTPELCSGFYEDGTYNYNGMTERLLSHEVHVFAPQLFLWETDNFPVISKRFTKDGNVKAQRQNFDCILKQMGGSVAALEITFIRRCIDYLEAEPYIDRNRIGMAGLSYGGFYTLFTTAVEPRIRCAICACYFSSKESSMWSDFVFPNASGTALDAEVALLVHPRKLWIESGRSDYVFDFADTEKEIERLKKHFGGTLPDNITYLPFDGDHEFSKDNAPIEGFIRELIADTPQK